MSEIGLGGDVRLVCDDPDALAKRLYIARLTFAHMLPDPHSDQVGQYSPESLALVPDPDSIRPCTPAETAHYIVPASGQTGAQSEIIFYIDGQLLRKGASVFPNGETPRWFGPNRFEAGELTTTPSDTEGLREGMHKDSGEDYEHRLTVCIRGTRQLLAATHSVPRIVETGGDVTSTMVRDRFMGNPELLGGVACLIVSYGAKEAYEAWTGAVVHDGSTWLSAPERGGDGSASEMMFAPL